MSFLEIPSAKEADLQRDTHEETESESAQVSPKSDAHGDAHRRHGPEKLLQDPEAEKHRRREGEEANARCDGEGRPYRTPS